VISIILKRALDSVPTIIIGITLTFLIVHLAPGDPGIRFLDPSQPAEIQQVIQKRFGLNEPLHVQYWNWVKRVLFHFDFGNSFYNGKPSSEVLRSALLPTILLAGCALVFALITGILLGILAATRSNTFTDRTITMIMMLFFSTPAFWLGIMFLGVFSIQLGWLPSSHLTSLYHDQLNTIGRFTDYIKHLFLPVLTLGLPLAATFFRYIRSGVIEALRSDYILGARARGIGYKKILFRYCLKNSLLPIISLLGVIIPALLSGAVIVEVIFSLPGMGRTMVTAVFGRDYPIILAASTLAFFAVVAGNMIADTTYSIIDPRIRYQKRKNS
jgi:peptide/nickel transport system permease protein